MPERPDDHAASRTTVVVGGEVLMDVLGDEHGGLRAHPGGAPFNVACFAARLGLDAAFVGRLSDDPFGVRLAEELRAAGVRLVVERPTPAPTTLALAALDASGSATYRFYDCGTSTVQVTPELLPDDLLTGVGAYVLGGLGIALEPIGATLTGLVQRAPDDVVVVLDPNCRPQIVRDLEAFRTRLRRLLDRVDVVKASVEDLAFIGTGESVLETARGLLAAGPSAVLVTDGGAPITVLTRDTTRSVPVRAAQVVDTIGAGDALVAAFVAGWLRAGLTRADCGEIDAVVAAVEGAVEVSAAVCSVAGAALPDDFAWHPATEGRPRDP